MNKSKSLTKNSIFYLLYTVLNVLFPLITGIYVARVLTPDTIGLVESAKNIVQYFVILSFLGIPTYALREISKIRHEKKELNKVYSELMVINFISTFFFLVSYLILVFSVPSFKNLYPLYLVVGISIFLNFFNNSWLFEALEEFGFVAIRNLAFKAISFLCLIILVKNENDYLWYAAITVVGTGGNYLLNIIQSRKIVSFSVKNINLLRHFKSIFFLVAVNFAIEIYTLVDVTMLKLLSGNESVAFYSYGSKINKILLQIINSFTMVLVPRIALYYKKGMIDDFNILLSKALKIIVLLSLPLIIGIWFVADFMIVAIYGSAYLSSSLVLKILSFVLLISPVGYLLGSRVCLATNNEKKMIIPVGIGALSNLLLNMLFIPYLNEHGAAIASVVSEIIVTFVYLLISYKYFRLGNMFGSLAKISLSLLIMFFFLLLMRYVPLNDIIRTIIQIVVSSVLYFALLALLKEDTVTEYWGRIKKRFFKKGQSL